MSQTLSMEKLVEGQTQLRRDVVPGVTYTVVRKYKQYAWLQLNGGSTGGFVISFEELLREGWQIYAPKEATMNERQQIDWSQVVPGKTWLESPNGCLCRVDSVIGNDVWVYYHDRGERGAYHLTWTKSSIDACKWRIREEWEDITEDCYFEWDSFYGESRDVTSIFYRKNGLAIRVDSKQDYKLKGRRIYKRRTL